MSFELSIYCFSTIVVHYYTFSSIFCLERVSIMYGKGQGSHDNIGAGVGYLYMTIAYH